MGKFEHHYAYMPDVLVYPSGGGFKMKVDGTSRDVGVQRLHLPTIFEIFTPTSPLRRGLTTRERAGVVS